MKTNLTKEIDLEKLERNRRLLDLKFEYLDSTKDDKSCFIGIAEYVKFINQSDYLTAIVKAFIIDDGSKLFEDLKRISDIVIEESNKEFAKLKDELEKKKIDTPLLRANILDYENVVSQKTKMSGYLARNISNRLRDIIVDLQTEGYEEITKKYEVIDRRGLHQGWKLVPSEKELDKIIDKIEDQRKFSLWSAWDVLYQASSTVFNKDEMLDEAQGNSLLQLFYISPLISQRNQILDGRDDGTRGHYFDIPKMRSDIKRIHFEIIKNLEDLLSIADKPKKAVGKSIQVKPLVGNILSINNIDISLKMDSIQHKVCKIVLKNEKNMSRVWDREEILEKIFGEDNLSDLYPDGKKLNPKYRRKIYTVAEKLNARILQKADVRDFFVFDTQKLQLNPKFVS